MDQIEKELLEQLKKEGIKVPAYEMTYDRNFVIGRVRSKGPSIGEHILKCVVYSEDIKLVYHWANEVADELEILDQYGLKPKGKKLKAAVYSELLKADFGESVKDMKVQLMEFRNTYTKTNSKKQYPRFEITPELIVRLFRTYTNIINRASQLLSVQQDTGHSEFLQIVIDEIKRS